MGALTTCGYDEEKKQTRTPQGSVSIIDERSFQCPGIVLISADLAALAAGLTTQVGGQGGPTSDAVDTGISSVANIKNTHDSTVLYPRNATISRKIRNDSHHHQSRPKPTLTIHTTETLRHARRGNPWVSVTDAAGPPPPGPGPAEPYLINPTSTYIFPRSQECDLRF